ALLRRAVVHGRRLARRRLPRGGLGDATRARDRSVALDRRARRAAHVLDVPARAARSDRTHTTPLAGRSLLRRLRDRSGVPRCERARRIASALLGVPRRVHALRAVARDAPAL